MYKKNNEVVIKKRGDIYFGLNLTNGTTFELNEVAYDIINFFENDDHKSQEELIDYLLDVYDTTRDMIIEDVQYLLNKLLDDKVIFEFEKNIQKI